MKAYKNVKIKKSKLHGRGVFTKKAFKRNHTILHLKGKVIGLEEFNALPQKTRDNTIRMGQDLDLNPTGEVGQLVNHSCSPNTKIIKKNSKLYLHSIKNIESGEELTFDYATILAPQDEWKKKCSCGSQECRRIIQNYSKLPRRVLKKYVTEKIIPKYILAIK